MTEDRPAFSGHPDEAELRLLSRVRERLDDSCARLDAATLSRLNTLRHRAMAATSVPQRLLAPFGTLAGGCALLLVLAIGYGPVRPLPDALPEPSLADRDLFRIDEDLKFFEELEFIQWLANTSE